MGKTNPTDRATLERLENNEWDDYRRTLRRRNQPLFDDLWKKARNHADAANAANPRPMDGALFSMLLAQQREIIDLQEENEELRETVATNAGRIESLENAPSVDGMQVEIEMAEDPNRDGRTKQGWHAWHVPHQLD